MTWFKLYAEFASDPKVQSMSEAMQRRLVMLFCLQCTGDLAKLEPEEMILALRIPKSEFEKTHALFLKKGFINEDWSIRNWRKRQAPSDPTAAERMARMRARRSELDRNVTRNVTPPVTAVTNSLRVEEEGETEAEGESPPPPLASLPPEYAAVARHAEEQGGDVSWAIWSDRMGRAGHPAALIRRAIDEAAGAGKLSQAYAAKILQRWAVEGPPNGRAAPAPAKPVEREYVTAGPEHIHPKFRRQA